MPGAWSRCPECGTGLWMDSAVGVLVCTVCRTVVQRPRPEAMRGPSNRPSDDDKRMPVEGVDRRPRSPNNENVTEQEMDEADEDEAIRRLMSNYWAEDWESEEDAIYDE